MAKLAEPTTMATIWSIGMTPPSGVGAFIICMRMPNITPPTMPAPAPLRSLDFMFLLGIPPAAPLGAKLLDHRSFNGNDHATQSWGESCPMIRHPEIPEFIPPGRARPGQKANAVDDDYPLGWRSLAPVSKYANDRESADSSSV